MKIKESAVADDYDFLNPALILLKISFGKLLHYATSLK